MNVSVIKQAITPLRVIFWGGLLCIFDLNFSSTTNGQGFKFDILNDAVGAVLIAVGVFRLSAASVSSRYATVMQFVKVVSVLAVLNAIFDHFIMPLQQAVYFVLNVYGVVALVAIVAFCVAMRWFCQEADLRNSARSWRVTTALFVVIYLIPLGLLYVVMALAIATRRSFSIDLGPTGLLLLPVFAVPLIHLFVSTSRMSREAESLTELKSVTT